MAILRSRADALAHREQLLTSAEHVFTEHGVTAPLDLIVAHAGVGRATLYRHFPDRKALMLGLLERTFVSIEDHAASLPGSDDDVFSLLAYIGDHVAESAPLIDFWRAMPRGDETVGWAHQRLAFILSPPLSRALKARRCRANLRIEDLVLACSMLGSCLRGSTVKERKTLARRAVALLTAGLSAPPTRTAGG